MPKSQDAASSRCANWHWLKPAAFRTWMMVAIRARFRGRRRRFDEHVLSYARPGIVAVYDKHQYLDKKRKALEQWAGHVEGLKPKSPAGNKT